MKKLHRRTFENACLIFVLVLVGCTGATENAATTTAKEVIQKYQMTELMEGIYINIDHRSSDSLLADNLPGRYEADHVFFSTIYYMITPKAKDSFHALKSDEIWHWYEGDPVLLTIINRTGELQKIVLGKGKYQHTVQAGSWYFSNQLGDTYSLVGLVVVPGFEDSDFRPGNQEELLQKFPEHRELILANTEK